MPRWPLPANGADGDHDDRSGAGHDNHHDDGRPDHHDDGSPDHHDPTAAPRPPRRRRRSPNGVTATPTTQHVRRLRRSGHRSTLSNTKAITALTVTINVAPNDRRDHQRRVQQLARRHWKRPRTSTGSGVYTYTYTPDLRRASPLGSSNGQFAAQYGGTGSARVTSGDTWSVGQHLERDHVDHQRHLLRLVPPPTSRPVRGERRRSPRPSSPARPVPARCAHRAAAVAGATWAGRRRG